MTNLTNLNEVLAAMLATNTLDWTSLPTFGEAPEGSNLECVWSWDDKNAIVGECAADLEIIPKDDIDW